MDEKIESFVEMIKGSLDNVGDEYYKITTTYESSGIVRERVFCYELYHQMRLVQSARGLTDVQIHGEIDKSGHIAFDRNSRKNPDFVFHVPGMMKGNAIVVEVKGKIEGNYQEGVYKDIVTLSKFTNNNNTFTNRAYSLYTTILTMSFCIIWENSLRIDCKKTKSQLIKSSLYVKRVKAFLRL